MMPPTDLVGRILFCIRKRRRRTYIRSGASLGGRAARTAGDGHAASGNHFRSRRYYMPPRIAHGGCLRREEMMHSVPKSLSLIYIYIYIMYVRISRKKKNSNTDRRPPPFEILLPRSPPRPQTDLRSYVAKNRYRAGARGRGKARGRRRGTPESTTWAGHDPR